MKKTLKSIILEDKEFGDYFAGEERELPMFAPVEKNTPEESMVVTQINHKIYGNHKLDRKTAMYITNFLRDKDYSDIIFEPKQEFVYRGMTMSSGLLDDFLKRSGVKDINTVMNIKGFYEPQNPIKFNPKNVESSWSKDKNIAWDFTESDPINSGILFRAKISDNPNQFLDLEQWYKEVRSTNSHEKEAIGFGEILISGFKII